MVMREVCDAWIEELTHITELANAKTHRYSSWSSAAVSDSKPGLHLAVWPEGDPETARGVVAASPPVHEITTSYQVQVWEGATLETTRVFDDDDANGAWVDLYEAVTARLYVLTNQGIGDPGSDLKYEGGALTQVGDKRVFAVRFSKRRNQSFT